MKAILHVGTHKTGTTTIQNFAAANRAELARRGLIYPDYRFLDRPDPVGHHDLARALSSEQRHGMIQPDDVRRLVDHLARTTAASDTLLISAEPFYRHLRFDPATGTKGNWWEDRARYVSLMAEIFGPLNPEILVVFRRQDDFIESNYQEAVKSGGQTQAFPDYIESNPNLVNYRGQLDLLQKAFPKVRVRIFEDIAKPDLLTGFFSDLGIDLTGIPRIKAKNESLPLDIVLYLRELNATVGNKARKRLLEDLHQLAANRAAVPSNFRFFSPEGRRAFVEKFRDDSRWLAQFVPPVEGRDGAFPPVTTELPSKLTLTPQERAAIEEGLARIRQGRTRHEDKTGPKLFSRLLKTLGLGR